MRFIELHVINTHYDKNTTAAIYPITVDIQRILYIYEEKNYEYWGTINLESIENEKYSGNPTMIIFAHQTSIRVAESYEYISKLLKEI